MGYWKMACSQTGEVCPFLISEHRKWEKSEDYINEDISVFFGKQNEVNVIACLFFERAKLILRG